MDKVKRATHKMYLAFSKGGLQYVAQRIPSIVFWSTISTGLLIGAQFIYYSALPAEHFVRYDNPLSVSNAVVGQRPTIKACRNANDDYQVEIYAQIRKVEPPVFTQNYQDSTTVQKGYNCFAREVRQAPTIPGDYKVFYTAEINLPFGIKKYTEFETQQFTIELPNNVYSEYRLTIVEKDQDRDGMAVYKRGEQLAYEFTATLLVTTFGSLERHIVCEGGGDYLIDVQSGRIQAGEKDTVDRTLTLPAEAVGVCHLGKRYTVSVEGGTQTVTETLRSNDFRVE